MPETPPQSPVPPDVDVGSGRTELIVLLALVVISLLVALYTFDIFPGLSSTVEERLSPNLVRADSIVTAQQEASLRTITTYGVADSAAGRYHVPIDTAITMLLQDRGAPVQGGDGPFPE